MSRVLIRIVLGIVFLAGVSAFSQDSAFQAAAATPAAKATVPRLVRFSGALKDVAGKSHNGIIDVTFSLYREEASGEPLWFETQTVEADAQGRYSVLLGSMHPEGLPMDLFTSGEARWLGVSVGRLPEQARVLLVAVPYALKAADADTLGGKPATAFVASDQLKDQVQSVVQAQTAQAGAAQGTRTLIGTSPTPQVISETSPATFTCATSGVCVQSTQSGAGGIALRGTTGSATGTAGIFDNLGGGKILSGRTTGYAEKFYVDGSGNLWAGGSLTANSYAGTSGAAVFGVVTATSGAAYGVRGQSASTSGVGVFGYGTSPTGLTYGLLGSNLSASGTGLSGSASSPTGVTIGVRAVVQSPNGTAAIFDNLGGGKLLSARTTGYAEKFSVSGTGKVTAGDAVFAGSGAAGAALVANNTAGGMIFSGRNNGVEEFSIDWTGKITGGGGTFTGSTSLFDPIVSVTQDGSGGGLRVTSTNALGGAIYGTVSASSGTVSGVLGASESATGTGVTGFAFETGGTGVYGTGGDTGVWGESNGVGVRGVTTTSFSTGVAGLFKTKYNNSGKLLSGLNNSDNEVFSVTGTGNLVVSGSITTGTGGLIGAGGSYSGTTADQIVSVLQSGTGSGLVATTLSTIDGPAAIRGQATASAANSHGIGVHGYAASEVGIGVKGEASGSVGIGVKGLATNASGISSTVGVMGETAGTGSNSAGVYGKATPTSGFTYGVIGDANASADGTGVLGQGKRIGVEGSGWGNNIGVLGTGTPGVKGDAYQFSGTGVHGTTKWGIGVLGESTYGGSATATGVKGVVASLQDGATGVFGDATAASGATMGVHGRSAGSTGIGVLGEATSTSFDTFGVKGTSQSSLGTAVAGIATNGGVGVYGESDTWAAGDFNRTDDSDLVILQARNGADVEFKVLGNGNVYADGTFQPAGADFAEAMAARGERDQYEPGDVMVIDRTGTRRVELAREPYSALVGGIYSTKPGMLGRPYSMDDPRLEQGIPLAVVGIVPCKVSAENGPIEVGDMLVTSATPGHAMKGTDRARMLGAVVGKALDQLHSGSGVIEVLVTLQ